MTAEADEGLEPQAGELGAVDWQALRERLAGTVVDDAASQVASEKRRRVLHERAEILARQEETPSEDLSILPVLQFALGDERYAVSATAVREICRVKSIRPVPGAPAHLAGVMPVRGRIVAVLDLSSLVEAPASRQEEEEAFAVVLRGGEMEFAVIADHVIGLRSVATSSLQVDVSGLVGARRAYLLGVTPDRVAVLDAQRLLGDEALVAMQQRSDTVNSGGDA